MRVIHGLGPWPVKPEEVITDEPHAGKLARVVLTGGEERSPIGILY